jgi:cytochrome c oxidase subunit IV
MTNGQSLKCLLYMLILLPSVIIVVLVALLIATSRYGLGADIIWKFMDHANGSLANVTLCIDD